MWDHTTIAPLGQLFKDRGHRATSLCFVHANARSSRPATIRSDPGLALPDLRHSPEEAAAVRDTAVPYLARLQSVSGVEILYLRTWVSPGAPFLRSQPTEILTTPILVRDLLALSSALADDAHVVTMTARSNERMKPVLMRSEDLQEIEWPAIDEEPPFLADLLGLWMDSALRLLGDVGCLACRLNLPVATGHQRLAAAARREDGLARVRKIAAA